VTQIVVISDLHAHPWAAFARGDGMMNSRLAASLVVLARSLEDARTRKAAWVFAGDLVHTAGYSLNVVMTQLTELLGAYADVEKLVVWGNHDARGIGGQITRKQTIFATLAAAVPRLTVLDPTEERLTFARGLSFSGAGYQPTAGLLALGDESDVGVYHQTVRGSRMANGIMTPEGINMDALLERHKLCIVGHVHHPQVLFRDKTRAVLIPGSPEHQNFGDAGEHGYWLVDMEGELQLQMEPGGSPKFLTVDDPSSVHDDGNFYRVRAMPPGTQLDGNAVAIAPSPTVVQQRATLKAAAGTEQMLAAWIVAHPPEGFENPLDVGRRLLASVSSVQLDAWRVERMTLQDFCSYAQAEFVLREGVWLVLGRGRDFPSNGAGKSTLFEAMFWALFGRTTKGLTGDEVIRWGAESCTVHLTLAHPSGGQLVVRRSRGKASKLEVEYSEPGGERLAWEAASVTEMTRKLTERLGLTPELFQALAYFSQERLLLFASATDSVRKEMLADLLGLAGYQTAATEAGRKVEELTAHRERIAAARAEMRRLVGGEEEQLAEDLKADALWRESWHVRLERAHAALREFEKGAQSARAESIAASTVRLAEGFADRRQRISEQQRAIKARLAALAPQGTREAMVVAQQEHQAAAARLQDCSHRRAVAVYQADQAYARMVQEAGAFAAGRCPTCGHAMTAKEQARLRAEREREVAEARHAVDVCTRQDEEARAQLSVAQAALTAATDGLAALETAQRLIEQQRDLVALLDQIADDERYAETVATQHADAALAKQREGLETAVRHVEAEINPHAKLVEATRERLAMAMKRLAEFQREQDANRQQINAYAYWQHAFSKQGIQSLLLDEIAALFNAERGVIFPALTQGVYDVQFSTTSQTKGGETRERTAFQVYAHGQPVPYAALSGGQRRRIDVGVMLTLVKAVSKWMQSPGALGVLVLDEVFGFLDASGEEGLMEALREVNAHVPTIYAVSQNPELQALFADVLVVEQQPDGTSVLR